MSKDIKNITIDDQAESMKTMAMLSKDIKCFADLPEDAQRALGPMPSDTRAHKAKTGWLVWGMR